MRPQTQREYEAFLQQSELGDITRNVGINFSRIDSIIGSYDPTHQGRLHGNFRNSANRIQEMARFGNVGEKTHRRFLGRWEQKQLQARDVGYYVWDFHEYLQP